MKAMSQVWFSLLLVLPSDVQHDADVQDDAGEPADDEWGVERDESHLLVLHPAPDVVSVRTGGPYGVCECVCVCGL